MKRKKTVAYGYVGTWLDGELGWHVPRFLYSGTSLSCPEQPDCAGNKGAIGEKAILCKITIEEVPNKRRRKFK